MEAVIDFVLTDRAIKAIQKMAMRKKLSNPIFRVGLIKEGCAGYKYHTEFDENIRENDIVIDYGDFKLAIDKDSYEHLKGTELDYIENLLKPNNFIFNNPNIKKTCKCGSSFNFGN